jgi:thiamine biosynthesis lipoprotein
MSKSAVSKRIKSYSHDVTPPACFLRFTSHVLRLTSYVLLSIVFCLLILSGCTKKEKMYKESRILMDTFCSITIVASSRAEAKEAIEAGFTEIKKLETLLNYFSPDSEISAVNRSAGIVPVRVSRETLEIVQKAVAVSNTSGGAFDTSIAPVISLWKFSKSTAEQSIPSENEIEGALKLVDFTKIKINESRSEIFLEDKGMELDLGGIAKGYAADKAADVIKARGIKSALVAIAGDIRGFGLNSSRNAWKVGIQNPRPESDSEKPWEDIIASLGLENSAISTSGDYQRFFMNNGTRYHHILDSKTGFSAVSGLISSSVIAPEGYYADGLSTAVFVLGIDEGIKLLESKGFGGVLVDAGKKIHLTKGLRDKIVISNKAYQLNDER